MYWPPQLKSVGLEIRKKKNGSEARHNPAEQPTKQRLNLLILIRLRGLGQAQPSARQVRGIGLLSDII